jgi:glycosyltransferase involved in cell wall biosynthesis
MDTSVIVVTYNRAQFLARCLKSLVKQVCDGNYQIVVIDDGSTDRTREAVHHLQRMHQDIVYYFKEHGGLASARNEGLLRAKGRTIAFTDDDCIVPRNWLKSLEEKLEEHSAAGVGGSTENPSHDYLSWTYYLLHFSSWFPVGPERITKNIPTANIAYRAEAIEGQRFPEYLGTGDYEDSLFNYHLARKGGEIVFCPGIVVKHFGCTGTRRLKSFFQTQERTALGFVRGGYVVHGRSGEILMKARFLNLLCPALMYVFVKCLEAGYCMRFFYHLPLLFAGEFYKGLVILRSAHSCEKGPKLEGAVLQHS